MHEKMIRQFNSDVAEALSARRAAGLTSRKAALALLKAPGWTETLEGLLPIRQRLTCAQALELCRQLRTIPGLQELCLTTNGALLPQLAAPLWEAGLDRLNISLDTPVYYICRRVLADNTPVLFSTDIVPCSLFGTTRTAGIDIARPSFIILDEACGIQVSSTITHLRAAMGDPAVRHALALQRDQALLELSETCYSRLCRPVLRCRTFYTDFFDFALVRKLV